MNPINILKEPNIILAIVRFCLCKNVLLLCKQWRDVLYESADNLRAIISDMSPPDVPARFYNMMTFKQKVVLPNFFMEQGELLSPIHNKYKIRWIDITAHCMVDSSDVRWLLNMSDDELRPVEATSCYYIQCFSLYEAFRRHAINNIQRNSNDYTRIDVPRNNKEYTRRSPAPAYLYDETYGMYMTYASVVSVWKLSRDFGKRMTEEMQQMYSLLNTPI